MQSRRNLPRALLAARSSLLGHQRAILRQAGQSEERWRVLCALADVDGLEAGAVSDATLISRPSLSVLLGRLERNGLVRRERDTHDQRCVRVFLAPAGRALVAGLAARIGSLHGASRMPCDRAERLCELLEQVIEIHARRRAPGGPAIRDR